jgi:hypothetical protein
MLGMTIGSLQLKVLNLLQNQISTQELHGYQSF